MIEIKDGINFHNLYLDYKSEAWFKRKKDEAVTSWLFRTSYLPNESLLPKLKFRQDNDFWLRDSAKISFAVLSFLRENSMQKSTLEDLIGFEFDLSGSYDFKLSELRKLELYLNKKLL